jgi:hypothetical protein
MYGNCNYTPSGANASQRVRQLLGAWLFITVLALAAAGLAFLIFGSLDWFIVRQCELHGYWQTGQTRVLCEVDKTVRRKDGTLL